MSASTEAEAGGAAEIMNGDYRRIPGVRARGSWSSVWLPMLLLFCGAPPLTARGQAVREQAFALAAGWNAIYLEIDPLVSAPADLFSGKPVDVVATYAAAKSGAQFVRDPGSDMLSAYGWMVWYAPRRPDAFLTTLHGVCGARPYLVHATTNTTLALSGTIAPEHVVWTPDAYNFVGFCVDEAGAPTFEQFFRGSAAHRHNKLYRMVNGTWRQVLDPGGAVMRRGEAFWIYCDGRSDYPGPLEVSTPTPFGVALSSRSGGEVIFRNRTDHPLSFAVEHIVNEAQPIPISVPVYTADDVVGALHELSVHLEGGYFKQQFPPLEAGKGIRLPLALRLRDAGPGERYSLLRVVTDMGTVTYVSITASRDDL